MSDMTSPRLALPLLQPGQSQKEMSHNEALLRLDTACQLTVPQVGADTPPADPQPGEAWILGASPGGAWNGHADAVALWSEGGWRFIAAFEGMRAWAGPTAGIALYTGGAWHIGESHGRVIIGGVQIVGERADAIADPAGGATIDAEARAALSALLVALRSHGLIATE